MQTLFAIMMRATVYAGRSAGLRCIGLGLLLGGSLLCEAYAGCHCRETDIAVEVRDDTGNEALICAWSDSPARLKAAGSGKLGPLSMMTIRDCNADTLLLDGGLDDQTFYFVEQKGALVYVSEVIHIPLGAGWSMQAVPFTDYTLNSVSGAYTLSEGSYAFVPPKIRGSKKDSLLAVCRSVASAIPAEGSVDFPGAARDIRVLFLGAISNVHTARWLFADLTKYFTLDENLGKQYRKLLAVYSVIADHEGFDSKEKNTLPGGG